MPNTDLLPVFGSRSRVSGAADAKRSSSKFSGQPTARVLQLLSGVVYQKESGLPDLAVNSPLSLTTRT